MENLYRIEELHTSGWVLIDSTAVRLSKPVATEMLENYLSQGYNPNYLRVVVDNN